MGIVRLSFCIFAHSMPIRYVGSFSKGLSAQLTEEFAAR